MASRILHKLGFNTNPDHDALIITVSLIVILIIVGTFVFHKAEGLHRFDSLYFAMVSVSTIGYGDITPHTIAGKIIAMIYSITGVPLFIYTAGLFIEKRIKSMVAAYIENEKQQNSEIQIMSGEIDKLEDVVDELEEKLEETSKHKKSLWRRLISRE